MMCLFCGPLWRERAGDASDARAMPMRRASAARGEAARPPLSCVDTPAGAADIVRNTKVFSLYE